MIIYLSLFISILASTFSLKKIYDISKSNKKLDSHEQDGNTYLLSFLKSITYFIFFPIIIVSSFYVYMLYLLPNLNELTINKAENIITELDKFLDFTIKTSIPDWLLLAIIIFCFVSVKNIQKKIKSADLILNVLRFSLTLIALLSIFTFYGNIYTDNILDKKKRISIELDEAKANVIKIGIASQERTEKIKEKVIQSFMTSVIENEQVNLLKKEADGIADNEKKLNEAQQIDDLKNVLDETSLQTVRSQVEISKAASKQIIKSIHLANYNGNNSNHNSYRNSDLKDTPEGNKNLKKTKSNKNWKYSGENKVFLKDPPFNKDKIQNFKNYKFDDIEITLSSLNDEIKKLDRVVKLNRIKIDRYINSDQIISKTISILNSQGTKKILGNALKPLGMTGDMLNILLDALFHDSFEQYLAKIISDHFDPIKRIKVSSFINELKNEIDTIIKECVAHYQVDDRLKVYSEVSKKLEKVNENFYDEINNICKTVYTKMNNDFKYKLTESTKSVYLPNSLINRMLEDLDENYNKPGINFRKKLIVLNDKVTLLSSTNLTSSVELGNFIINNAGLSSASKKQFKEYISKIAFKDVMELEAYSKWGKIRYKYLQQIEKIDTSNPVAFLVKDSLQYWENYLKSNSIKIVTEKKYGEKLFYEQMKKNHKLYAVWCFLCIPPENSEMTAGGAIDIYLSQFGESYDDFKKEYNRSSTLRNAFNGICGH